MIRMNYKNSQISINIILIPAFFIISWIILGVMELDSGFISDLMTMILTEAAGIDNASFLVKFIIPIFFFGSLFGFVLWLKGAVDGSY